jgi:hypothetical protein
MDDEPLFSLEAQKYERKTIACLRRDDPSETFIWIHLDLFSDDALTRSLSEALQLNNHVKGIRLSLGGEAVNWNSLLHVIAARENLEAVSLDDEDGPSYRVTPYLLAIQQNPRVKTVHLSDVHLPGNAFASFLDTAKSVTSLIIYHCNVEASARTAISAAFQRNTNIETLKLDLLDEMDLIPIVNGLASNTSVMKLELCYFISSLNISLALSRLLESTETLQRFELCVCHQLEADALRPIVQGLIRSKSVTDVSFIGCHFQEKEDVLILNSIFQSKANLHSLAFKSCHFKHSVRQFHAALFSLLQPHSLLRSFELCSWHDFYGFKKTQDFDRLYRAVETSPLERFSIGRIASRKKCQALIASIPKMQVRTLEFNFHHDLQHMKGHFLHAVKRNASLRTVVDSADKFRTTGEAAWLDDDDREKLNSYSLRNEFLAQWIGNPSVVLRAAWPVALDVAQTTGPDTVFRIFQGLAPSLAPVEDEHE